MNESSATSSWVFDADQQTFQALAVERSRQTLVVVDFWAAWCQPCRLLGPVLEKLAADYGGKFVLVKADVDKLPAIAAGFGVESIPAVYALADGSLLDYFVGVRSEAQLRAWIDRLLPSPAQMLVTEARGLETSAPAAAEAKYREAIELDANLAAAKIGLAALLLAADRMDESRAIVDELEARGFLEPEAEKLEAQLHLHAEPGAPSDLEALRSAVARRPDDLDARLKLAEALAAAGQHDEALPIALSVVETHNKEFVDRARELMVDIFRLLPDDSPLTGEFRRRLSTALY